MNERGVEEFFSRPEERCLDARGVEPGSCLCLPVPRPFRMKKVDRCASAPSVSCSAGVAYAAGLSCFGLALSPQRLRTRVSPFN